jgi:hypothetical protein
MDPQPPPLGGWPPPLPPPVEPSPPAPPAWPPPAYDNVTGPSHAVRWTLGALGFLAVVAVGILLFVGHRPAVASIAPPTQSQSPASTPSSSATPVSAAVTLAGQQYLAAVAPVNADGSRFHAALLADEGLPCTCSPGEFEVREDALSVIPTLDKDTEALQVVLQNIKTEVPAIAADIDTVVADNVQYTGYLADAYQASQTKGGAVGYYIGEAEAVDQGAASDFARVRSDLGLPAPPSS